MKLQLEAGATFIMQDLAGQIAESRYVTVEAVLRALREHSLEDFYMHGYDPKPYKQANGTVEAFDMALWTMGFSSFGPRHTRVQRRVVPKPRRAGVAAGWSRVFDLGDYGYHRLYTMAGRELFDSWLDFRLDGATPGTASIIKDVELTRVWTRAFNRLQLNSVGGQFETSLHDQKLAEYLRTKAQSHQVLRLALKANKALYRMPTSK